VQTIRLPEMNLVQLVGRLTRDPELRFTQKGSAMCRFDLAVNRRYKDAVSGEWKDDTTFVPVVVWREVAERCKEKLAKGSPVQVEGRLKTREYEDKTGQKRKVMEVEARRIQFLASTGTGAGSSRSEGSSKVSEGSEEPGSAGDELEEVPF
jgi:single-strand DNA-binding protein